MDTDRHLDPQAYSSDRDPIATLVASPPGSPRDVDALHAILDEVAEVGWDCPAATALLGYIRTTIVRPLVVDLGLRGGASSEAEATAWEEVWEVLRSGKLSRASSPWGVLWSTARRAVLSEAMCAMYPTSPKRAWDLASRRRDSGPSPIESLPDLDHAELPHAALDGTAARPRPGVAATVDALVDVGWARSLAEEIVLDVLTAEPDSRSTRWMAKPDGWAASGWRAMALRLGLPDWQARRLMVALRGTPQRPGLLPRLIRAGASEAALDPVWWAALAATRDRTLRSPSVPGVTRPQRSDGGEKAERRAS